MYLTDGRPDRDIYVIGGKSKHSDNHVEYRNIVGTSAQDVYDRHASEFETVSYVVPDRV